MFDLSDIVVKAGDTTLRYGVDYVISYENNTDFGTAKLVIKGIDGYTGILEHTFAITQKAKVMTGITWNTKPEKVIYTEGETLDVTGLVINVVYDDDSTEAVAYSEANADEFTFRPALDTKRFRNICGLAKPLSAKITMPAAYIAKNRTIVISSRNPELVIFFFCFIISDLPLLQRKLFCFCGFQ